MRVVSVLISAAFCFLFMTASRASECRDGCKIVSIQPYGGSPGTIVYVAGGTWNTTGNCASTEAEHRFLVDATKEPRAKELLGVALVALSTGASVFVKGNGSCPYYSIEEVLFIKVDRP